MAKTVKINKGFKFNENFWNLNPQISMIKPFSDLYDRDEGGRKSSDHMWACFFMCDPDEEENLMYRYSSKVRRENISRRLEIDWADSLFQECLDQYPQMILNSIERSLRDQNEALRKRSEHLKNTAYELDHYMVDDMGEMIYDKSGKPILVKGTAKQLDDAWAKSSKIYEDLEKAYSKFTQHKEEGARVYGNRNLTASEKGLV